MLTYKPNYGNWQVRDVLDELWEVSKKVAKGVLTAVGVTAGVAA